MSFKTKISLLITVTTAVILLLSSSFVYYGFKRASTAKVNAILSEQAGNLTNRLSRVPSNMLMDVGLWALELKLGQQTFQIFNEKGKLVYGYPNPTSQIGSPWYAYTTHVSVWNFQDQGDSLSYSRYTLILYQNVQKDRQFLALVRLLLIVSSLAGIGLAALFSLWIAGATIRPIRRMIDKVRQIGIEALHERLPTPRSRDDIYELSHTFNSLLQRIESGFEQQKQFVADASHELRTPIAIIEGHANMIKRWGKTNPEVLEESLDFILRETGRMRQLTNHLLDLAKLEQGVQAPDHESADITRLLQSLTKQLGAINRQLAFEYDGPDEPLQAAISEFHAQQVFLNLLDNAVKFTPAGGAIRVMLRRAGDRAEAVIQDTGSGIPPADLPHVFDRFYKADKSRRREAASGSGLGLSIVKRIVEGHGGAIAIDSRQPGGTTVRLSLPCAAPSLPAAEQGPSAP